jgi:predicted nucleic acid-binding protein
VHAEVLAGGSRPGAQELLAANWLQIVEAPAAAIAGFAVLVDRGEAEALALATAQP